MKQSIAAVAIMGMVGLTVVPFALIGDGKGEVIKKERQKEKLAHLHKGHGQKLSIKHHTITPDSDSDDNEEDNHARHHTVHQHGNHQSDKKHKKKKHDNTDSKHKTHNALHAHKETKHKPHHDASESSEGDHSEDTSPDSNTHADTEDPHPTKKSAHIVVVGNEKYVDGALVMGWSLNKYKTKSQELVCLVTEGKVHKESITRLERVGWDRVISVDSFAHTLKRSMWKDSFVKLHMFNFTEYDKVAYWDSDMAIADDPNGVFSLKIPQDSDNPHVIAIGSKPSKGRKNYFQTGMMVFRPTVAMHKQIWGKFEKDLMSYNTVNGRDGALLREFFGPHYSSLPDKFSRNIDPRKKIEGVVGVHYRGGYKPWFNRAKPKQTRLKGVDPAQDDTRKDFGYAYLHWWKLNEEMQRFLSSSRFKTKGKGKTDFWPSPSAAEDIERVWLSDEEQIEPASHKTHVHMLRHTDEAYVQPYSDALAAKRNLTYSGVTVRRSDYGQSCTETCKKHHETCHLLSLNSTKLNSCNFIKHVSGYGVEGVKGDGRYEASDRVLENAAGEVLNTVCTSCEPGIYTKQRKGDIHPSVLLVRKKKKKDATTEPPLKYVQCTYHLLLDERAPPSCDAADPDAMRLCPCVEEGEELTAETWDGQF